MHEIDEFAATKYNICVAFEVNIPVFMSYVVHALVGRITISP